MKAELKRVAMEQAVSSSFRKARSVRIEPLESRVFCDSALGAAVVTTTTRPTPRAVIVAHAGASAATAQGVGLLTQTVSFRDTLSPNALTDYFKFSVASNCTVALSLTSLTANADLQLVQINPTTNASSTVATSAHPGKTNESIGKKVSAGTYYARIFETGGTASYTLTLAAAGLTTSTPTPPTPPTKTTSGGLHFVFNYAYDTSGFFASHPQAKTLLTLAASAYSKFTNTLTAITPGGINTWSQTFSDPGHPGTQITLNNASIAGNTVVIYVGGSGSMQTAELGYGEPGGWNAMGTQAFVENVQSRGQSGALKDQPTAYSPWGGSICFSSTTNWNLSTAAPTKGQNDFLSVATHELAHILGFGTADSWFTDVSNGKFIGRHAEAVNGGKAVVLDPGLSHWADGIVSSVNGVSQTAEMDPYLVTGTRRAMTALDFAGLEDVGWTV